MKGVRVHLSGRQRAALLVALDGLIAREADDDLEAVRRKLDNRPTPVIVGQTDIDEMLATTTQLESPHNGPTEGRAKNGREP